MWTAVAFGILKALPALTGAAEQLFAGRGRGREKLETVERELARQEGPLSDHPDVVAARRALIAAQVAYANALTAADERAGKTPAVPECPREDCPRRPS